MMSNFLMICIELYFYFLIKHYLSKSLYHWMFLDICKPYLIISVVTITPLIGYLSQLRLIYKNQSVGSFSIDVCAILLIANILRIMFWFTNGFALNLFLQSFFILLIQVIILLSKLITLRLCIRLGYKSEEEEGFWRWNHFSSFCTFCGMQ